MKLFKSMCKKLIKKFILMKLFKSMYKKRITLFSISENILIKKITKTHFLRNNLSSKTFMSRKRYTFFQRVA